MSFSRRVSMGVLVLALGACVAACGGGSKPKLAAKSKDASSTTTSTTASPGGATAAGGGPTTTAPKGAGQGSTGNPGGASTPPTSVAVPKVGSLKVTISLSQPCIKPGASQTITVKVDTTQKVAVAYNTVYSDGNNWKMGPGYYGGNKGGVVDDGSGTYKDTWVLSPQAAPGVAQVVAFATMKDNGGSASSQFIVAGPSGHC